jgi:hypothetical protein
MLELRMRGRGRGRVESRDYNASVGFYLEE